MMDSIVVIDTCALIHIMYTNSFYIFSCLGYNCLTTKFIQLEINKGKEETRKYFYSLLNQNKLSLISLQIEDLVEIAKYPESRRISNGELSCFILTKRYGYKTMTDDEPAIKFAVNILDIDRKKILTMLELLLEAYGGNILNDNDLIEKQNKLKENHFIFQIDITYEAARRRLIRN